MSGFIQKAACSGHRPSQFAGFNGYQRSNLIARLINERAIARFLVAPTGYGKTSLLIEYAETMFAWVHVFWISGKSPCFIRDLDEGTIADDCLATDNAARLVVFDDVPALDPQRSEAFSEQIDELLAARCEVIVACTPRCDTLAGYQRDRVRITARELLLADDELDTTRSAAARAQLPASSIPDSGRVPALMWGQDSSSASSFVRSGLREPMPADLLLVMGSILAMRKGQVESLEAIGAVELETLEDLFADYPHLGFDRDVGSFEGPDISPDEMRVGIKGVLDAMVSASLFDSRESLVWTWAAILLDAEGDDGRACDLVRVLCPRTKRAPWLASRAETLVQHGCFLEGLGLAEAVHASPKDGTPAERAVCTAFGSICRVLLGDADGGVRAAKRVAFDEAVAAGPRTCCLLVVARNGNDLLRERACTLLEEEYRASGDLAPEAMSPWSQLAVSWRLLSDGSYRLAKWWSSLVSAEAPDFVLSLTASWLYGVVGMGYIDHDGQISPNLLDVANRAQEYVRSAVEKLEGSTCDFFAASAGLAMERAHAKGMPLAAGPLSSSALVSLRRWEMALLVQKTRFEGERERNAAVCESWAGNPAAGEVSDDLAFARVPRNAPIMKLRMFGRFEVSIGGVVIEDPAFRRKHVRLLLLVLATHLGRDMSRTTLAKTLWPDADDDLARRNLYAIWSRLRRALTLADGTCPYLARHQYGCSLDERYVQADVMRLNEICRELLFGRPDFKGWTSLYAEIDRDFSNELLPCEDGGEIVEQIRNDCRSRLVDALVSATRSVIDGGNNQLAIWFARAAVGHDETREDAYVALMQAQIANKQRTAAMMTYHACRRALANRLGMDPSPETNALYESLLDSL